MANILKLPDVWRVIRELDLESIRREAEARFRLVVLSESTSDAETVAALLSGGDPPTRGSRSTRRPSSSSQRRRRGDRHRRPGHHRPAGL